MSNRQLCVMWIGVAMSVCFCLWPPAWGAQHLFNRQYYLFGSEAERINIVLSERHGTLVVELLLTWLITVAIILSVDRIRIPRVPPSLPRYAWLITAPLSWWCFGPLMASAVVIALLIGYAVNVLVSPHITTDRPS